LRVASFDARSLVLARRVAHGLGGALAGTLVATCLAQAGALDPDKV
jgi:hypothetical protein